MHRAVIWKEVREQGLIGLTLVVLGSGVLAVAATLADPPTPGSPPSDVLRHLGVGLMATLMLAVTAGMVCGGAVFAAEREAGTMGFLESLPTSRKQLWLAKFVAGLGLAAAQAGLLVAVAAILGLLPTPGWAPTVGVFSLLAFAWGIFGSTLARTTLGSVGLAIPAAVVTSVLVLLPILLVFPARGATVGGPRPVGAILFLLLMFVIPLGLSAWAFAAPDRLRAAGRPGGLRLMPIAAGAAAPRRGRPPFGVLALAWMTLRQLRVPALVLSGFALVFGAAMLAPGTRPILVWPGLALAAGVLAGVTAFADEQTRGSARFWGEQRLPVGRAWAVKAGFHLLFGLWLLILLVLPLVLRTQFDHPNADHGRGGLAAVFRSNLFSEIGRNGWKYLLLPAAYGFAAGHLCGLLFRKPAVACGVAGIVGGVGAALWVPSLLAGGVSHWQLWTPPALALVTGRLLMPAWAAERLLARRPLNALAAGCAAAALAMVAGLGYRVVEVPERPGGEDDVAFAASLPPIDQNVGGRDFRTASERYARAASFAGARGESAESTMLAISPPNQRQRVEELFEGVIAGGWERATPDLANFLDRVYARPRLGMAMGAMPEAGEELWHKLAEKAADEPLGLFDYPQTIKLSSFREATVNARRMAMALLVHGLREHAAGKPAAFVNDLRTVVLLARTLRNAGVIASFQAGIDVEMAALVALDTWLRHLDGSPEHVALLRRARSILEAADPAEPFDPTPHFLAERYVAREALKGPAQWLPALLTGPGMSPDAVEPEVDFVGVAWAVPWERERTRRLVGLGFESGPAPNYAFIAGRPGASLLIRPRLAGELGGMDRDTRVMRRATILTLALRAYRSEHGKYPDPGNLHVLVEGNYLTRLPRDPYDDDRELRYRIARASRDPNGEPIVNESGEPCELLRSNYRDVRTAVPAGQRAATSELVPAGTAIVWSVGPDKIDNGGTCPSVSSTAGLRLEDIVFLVPREPSQ